MCRVADGGREVEWEREEGERRGENRGEVGERASAPGVLDSAWL